MQRSQNKSANNNKKEGGIPEKKAVLVESGPYIVITRNPDNLEQIQKDVQQHHKKWQQPQLLRVDNNLDRSGERKAFWQITEVQKARNFPKHHKNQPYISHNILKQCVKRMKDSQPQSQPQNGKNSTGVQSEEYKMIVIDKSICEELEILEANNESHSSSKQRQAHENSNLDYFDQAMDYCLSCKKKSDRTLQNQQQILVYSLQPQKSNDILYSELDNLIRNSNTQSLSCEVLYTRQNQLFSDDQNQEECQQKMENASVSGSQKLIVRSKSVDNLSRSFQSYEDAIGELLQVSEVDPCDNEELKQSSDVSVDFQNLYGRNSHGRESDSQNQQIHNEVNEDEAQQEVQQLIEQNDDQQQDDSNPNDVSITNYDTFEEPAVGLLLEARVSILHSESFLASRGKIKDCIATQ